jgi:BlaI family penicillinase repressor
MKKTPRITDTEWEIMRVVWAQHPLTAAQIIARLTALDSTWHPKTARTLLARLVEKKALDYEPDGRVYVYSPRLTEEECVAAASGSFVERVFGGSLTPMLAHFIEHHRLSRKELDELRALLDQPRDVPASARKRKGARPHDRPNQ